MSYDHSYKPYSTPPVRIECSVGLDNDYLELLNLSDHPGKLCISAMERDVADDPDADEEYSVILRPGQVRELIEELERWLEQNGSK